MCTPSLLVRIDPNEYIINQLYPLKKGEEKKSRQK